ncbi:MAG: polymer-forming cytoskeletal protein, partial [Chloroflexi bacterium]|nr:polymer-forming cytoskeletal protein [Chloroflexota bacterium]
MLEYLARGNKERDQIVAADDQNAEQPQRLRPARRSEVVLARGTRATGELKSEGDIRVDGVFEGRIEGVGWVIVGPEAQITGDIVARHVLVDGWVHGNVQAVGQVQVRPTGQVWGDVMAAQVLVDPGAEMHPAGEEPPPPRAAPARPPVEIRQPDEPSVSLSPAGRDWLRQPWAVAAGVIAAGILVVCGVLVLSGVFAGPGELGTPTQVAQRETATSTTAPTVRPTQTATGGTDCLRRCSCISSCSGI